MTFSKLKLVLVLIALPSIVFAQSNFKPGYVLTLKGDTIKGFIDYREWDNTPLTIDFKRSLAEKSVTTYGPGDISYFNINGIEEYRKYDGPVSTDPTSTYKVATGRDTSFKITSVFFKVLEKGVRLALYEFKDDIKERYFISYAPEYVPKELIYRIYLDPNWATNTNPNATKTITEFTYQKQLSAAALKYNELSDNLISYIARAEYTSDNILDIVSRINHYSKTEYSKTHYNGSVLNFFVGAAAFINTTTPGQDGGLYPAGGTSYTSVLPQFSVGVNLYANPATRKLQFRLELGDGLIKYQTLYNSKVVPYVPTEVSFNESTITISPQVIYNFYNTENVKAFVGFGIIFSHFSYSNVYFGGQDRSNAEAAAVAAGEPFIFENNDNSFILRAGLQFSKHLVLIGSYQTTVNNTNVGYFSLTSSASSVGINYIF